MTDHGPGMEWLAQRAGTSADELLSDRAALLRALTAAGTDALDLVARLGSEDGEVRKAAQSEAEAVRERFAQPEGEPTPGQRFARTVTEALRAETERLRNS